MMQAVVSNPQPVTASPWADCRPRRGSVRVRSTRNGAADNLDHLRRPPTATARQPRQQGNGNPAPRRRVIQTTPFGLWDSFPDARTLDQMMRTMERIMDEEDDDGGRRPFVVPGATTVSRSPTERRADDRRGRSPWEIKERAGDYLVRFDMPGMTREDVRVSVQDRTLVVVAEKAAKQGEAAGEDGNVEEGEEEEPWPAASYGRYRTRVELPENVEVERIAAEVRDGVLYLTIPKVSPSGGKVVSIQVQ